MQTFGLPRQVTRDALERWRQARADGLTARAAANAVGVPESTLWQRLTDRNRLNPCSRRPHTLRWPAWSAALVTAVQETRADYPMWDKARIAVLLQRDGHAVSESTTGRILKTLMERGAVTPVPSLRRNGPRAGGGRAHRARERWAAYFSSMTGKGSVVSVWATG